MPTVDDAMHRAVVQLAGGRLGILLYWPSSRPSALPRGHTNHPRHKAKVLIAGRHHVVDTALVLGVVAPTSYLAKVGAIPPGSPAGGERT